MLQFRVNLRNVPIPCMYCDQKVKDKMLEANEIVLMHGRNRKLAIVEGID